MLNKRSNALSRLNRLGILASFASTIFATPLALAGGGLILRDDVCIMEIGFYSAHFTAYQPATQGNTEFCQSLPDTGETVFVLDYLHNSMKEVAIDFRIIRDDSQLGQFVQLEDIQAIDNLAAVTVFYQQPLVHADASLQVDHHFETSGNYIGIVTAGHPTKDRTYAAVFPFTVGVSGVSNWQYGLILLLPVLALVARRYLRPTAATV